MATPYVHNSPAQHGLTPVTVHVDSALLAELIDGSEHDHAELMRRLSTSFDLLVRLRRPSKSLKIGADEAPALRLIAAMQGIPLLQTR